MWTRKKGFAWELQAIVFKTIQTTGFLHHQLKLRNSLTILTSYQSDLLKLSNFNNFYCQESVVPENIHTSATEGFCLQPTKILGVIKNPPFPRDFQLQVTNRFFKKLPNLVANNAVVFQHVLSHNTDKLQPQMVMLAGISFANDTDNDNVHAPLSFRLSFAIVAKH